MRLRGRRLLGAVGLAVLAACGALSAPSTVRSAGESRAADSLFSVTMSGPTAVTLNPSAAPDRLSYDVTVAYVGPAISEGAEVKVAITMTLSQLEMNPGITGTIPGSCGPGPPANTPGVGYSCEVTVDSHTALPFSFGFQLGARPTGKTGTGTTTVSLSTGASAGVSTTFANGSPRTTTAKTTPTPPPPPTTKAATVAAAPPTTVSETFTASTPPQTETAALSAAADDVTVQLSWPTSTASFDVTGIAIVRKGHVVARGPQSAAKPKRLVVTKKRTGRSLEVAIANPVQGTLRFEIVARKLGKPTRVRATIRQTQRL
jgi:hypothetical protein